MGSNQDNHKVNEKRRSKTFFITKNCKFEKSFIPFTTKLLSQTESTKIFVLLSQLVYAIDDVNPTNSNAEKKFYS